MMPRKRRFNVSDEHVAGPSKKKNVKRATSTTFDSESEDSSSHDHELVANNSDCSSVKYWDQFCWKCHKRSHDEVRCSKCVLSFHAGCVANLERDRANWLCPECQVAIEYGQRNSEDNGLVKRLVERVITYAEFNDCVDGFDDSLLVNPIIYSNIVEKAMRNEYGSVEAVLLDFKWILHNYTILCNQNQGSVENKKNAEELLKLCEDEMFDVENCPDCYMNRQKSDAFTMVCAKPHLLIWARYSGYPYWPAKIMKSQKKRGSKILFIHFFGEHNSANIPHKDAYLYSKEDPNVWCSDRTEDFKNAVQEAQIHINNIEKKFGPFQFAPFKTPVKPGNIDMEQHLEMMIPGLRNPALRPKSNDENGGNNGNENDHGEIVDAILSDHDASNEVQDLNVGASSSMMNISPQLPASKVNQTPNQVAANSSAALDELQASREYIKALENELKQCDKALEQRNRFIQKYREEIYEMDQKIKEAKAQQWCSKCLNSVKVEKPPVCDKCTAHDCSSYFL